MSLAVWLVDIGYVVKASEGLFKLDYVKAEDLLRERFGQVISFLFNGFDPAYGIPTGLQQFYDEMKRHGMQVRLQPMQSGLPGANRQRRVDVDLGAHLVWQASRDDVGTLVLTAGDQDYIPAIEIVREHLGKRVILFTYSHSVHLDLSASVDERWLFENEAARVRR